MDSPLASGARGPARVRFFTQDDHLVASGAQQELMRVRT
ncbi:hypothetical protein [Bradyrhizobium genosp. SA-3]